MAHIDQNSESNAQRPFSEEIATLLSSKDGISIFVHAWVPANPRRVLVCVQGLGGHGGYYRARHSSTSAFLRKVTSRVQRIVTFPQAYHCLLSDPDTPYVVEALNFWLTTLHEE